MLIKQNVMQWLFPCTLRNFHVKACNENILEKPVQGNTSLKTSSNIDKTESIFVYNIVFKNAPSSIIFSLTIYFDADISAIG